MLGTRTHSFVRLALGCAFAALPAICADAPSSASAPMNLARHRSSADLLLLDQTTQTYQPTAAAADWLDDCIGTGHVPEKGHHFYLLKFAAPQVFTRFNIDTRGCVGTVSLFGGDEPLPPGKSWRPLARDLNIAALGSEKAAQSVNCLSQYLLIETNLGEIAPWFDIHVFGDSLAEGLRLQKRDRPLNVRSVGRYVNEETSISLSSIAANTTVTSANPAQKPADLQKIIDDNPATGVAISASANLAINYSEKRRIHRVAVLVEPGTKGTLEFVAVKERGKSAARTKPRSRWGESDLRPQYILAAWDPSKDPVPEPRREISRPASPGREYSDPIAAALLPDAKQVASFDFDGRNSRVAANFEPTAATALVLRWKPETPGAKLFIIDVDSFGDETLREYEYRLPGVGEGPRQNRAPKIYFPEGPFPGPIPVSP